MNNKTKIITFAHCKGGVGKSTLCCHITTILQLNNPHLKIGLLDLDFIQNTSYNFFLNKKFKSKNLDFLSKSIHKDEINNIINYENLDILVIDTAGGSSDLTENAINLTNILITPIQHSLVDIKSLINIENDKIIDGPFTKIINKNTNKDFKWFLVHNKLPLVNIDNRYTDLITQISYKLKANLFTLYDRPEYRMSFEELTTPNEIIKIRSNFTRGQQIAAIEIETIYKSIMQYLSVF